MIRPLRRLRTTIILACLPFSVVAGGSGLNVSLVVNQASTNSVQLGNYYAEQRQLPPQNIIRINWAGGNAIWTLSEFETNLAMPLRNALIERGLTNQIEFVVLSMDIPYRIIETNGVNSTTSALFYGFKPDTNPPPNLPDSCSLPAVSHSAYAGSEGIFRNTAPGDGVNTYLVTMITASNLAQAKLIVDRGLAGDAAFPTQTVVLGKNSNDPPRNVRYFTFDNTVFDTRLRGNYSVQRANLNTPNGLTNMLGYQNGHYGFNISSDAFVPGAMADSLTSFGGVLFEPNGDQTTLLKFLEGGASGSYGTVVEPCNYLEKFPSPQNYFYQARGFSLAECYYQSLTNPYQGLIVGEPLAAPFAWQASGAWSNLPSNAVLTGTTNLTLQANAADAKHPLQQVDLFLDGMWFQTLTNISPSQSNVLRVTINGHSMSYVVPAKATIKSVAAGLTEVLNSTANQNANEVLAVAHGDRIELRSTDANRSGGQTLLTVSNSIGNASTLTTFINASRSDFLDTIAYGIRSFNVGGLLVAGDVLQLDVLKTNGAAVTVTVTNSLASGPISSFVRQLADAINGTSALQGTDGLILEDVTDGASGSADFNIRVRSAGLAASLIQVTLTGTFDITPTNTMELNENLADLQPRNHLYITAGVTNLVFSFPFNTFPLPDGYHELTAVVYEGSHVRTQKRIAQNIHIQNTPLAATINCLLGGSNAAIEATLQFAVTANTGGIAKIELFSTGGLLATVTNQSAASFSVAGTNLGLGLHPFYAVVTANGGKQYRTESRFIRLVGAESPFSLQLVGPPPFLLSWPAIAGRSYDVLSANAVTNAFLLRDTVVPTNFGIYQWREAGPNSNERFYRVRVSP